MSCYELQGGGTKCVLDYLVDSLAISEDRRRFSRSKLEQNKTNNKSFTNKHKSDNGRMLSVKLGALFSLNN